MSTTDDPDARRADEQMTESVPTSGDGAPMPVQETPATSVGAAPKSGRRRVLAIVAITVGALLALGLAFGGGFTLGSLTSRLGGPGGMPGAGAPDFERPDGDGRPPFERGDQPGDGSSSSAE